MFNLEENKLIGRIVDRDNKILELCRDRSVLHLGCADSPYYEYRHKTGTLLHEKLSRVASHLTGIDLDVTGVDFLKSIGFSNVHCGNVEELAKIDLPGEYDVIVAGELLEHLSNPGKFFEGLHGIAGDKTVLVVTVPNAQSIKGLLRAMIGKELIHCDHMCYFSPATMSHICRRYGYVGKEYFYYLSKPFKRMQRIFFAPISFLVRTIFPFWADGIIYIAERGVGA